MKYQELKGWKYRLVEEEAFSTGLEGLYQIDTEYVALNWGGRLWMKKGYAWDGSSVVRDTKTCMKASLVHDALYQLMREGLLDRKLRKYADQLYRDLCIQRGMWKVRAGWRYTAIRMFAKKYTFPSNKPRGKIVEI